MRKERAFATLVECCSARWPADVRQQAMAGLSNLLAVMPAEGLKVADKVSPPPLSSFASDSPFVLAIIDTELPVLLLAVSDIGLIAAVTFRSTACSRWFETRVTGRCPLPRWPSTP